MIRMSVSVLAIAVLAAGLTGSPAGAAPACKEGVIARGRAANPLNYDPPRRYDAQKLATKRAITAWSADVRARCGSYSPLWWRAQDKKISCEGYAGGMACTVSAVPAKKLL